MITNIKLKTMKKLFITFLMGTAIISAQSEKGTKFIGGTFNLSGSTTNQTNNLLGTPYQNSSAGYGISPEIGYFLKKNLAIGASINLYQSKTNNDGNGNSPLDYSTAKYNNIGASIFMKYYHPIYEKLYFLLNPSIGYGHAKNDFTNYNYSSNSFSGSTTKTNSFGVSIIPGISYFASSRLSFQTTFGNLFYNNSKNTNSGVNYDNTSKGDNYGLNLSSATLTFGMSYYFK